MGILSAAMASFAMRELRDIPADETRWLNLRSFLIWLHPPKNVPNHYPEHLLLKGNAQNSDLAHLFEDVKTLSD